MKIRKMGIEEEKQCSKESTKCYVILYSVENPYAKDLMMHTFQYIYIYIERERERYIDILCRDSPNNLIVKTNLVYRT